MRRTKVLESTAYHEAGHAMMAWHEGLWINEISIVPDDDSSGRILHANPLRGIQLDIDNSNRARIRAESAIRVALAGAIAQRHHNPHGFRHRHAEADYDLATDVLLYIVGSGEEADAYMNLLAIQTRQIVTGPHWNLVEYLAKALLERQRLSRKEIRATIMQSMQRNLGPSKGVIKILD